MPKSMTGYGRGEAKDDSKILTVELKSVNHRYIDIMIRMPKKISSLEEKIKKKIKSYISRGRIEVYISLDEYNDTSLIIKPNIDVLREYYDALIEIKKEFMIQDEISLSQLTNYPDAFLIESKEEDEESIWNSLNIALEEALKSLIEMRNKEGIELAKDISKRGKRIYNLVKEIELKSPLILKEYKMKLLERIKELSEDNIEIDENRLALEVSIYADKSNITEEIVRLNSHLDRLKGIVNEDGPIGRKLDFLIQEMNREINTIGSKSSDVDIANYVIEIKSELEKIREQVQNIE